VDRKIDRWAGRQTDGQEGRQMDRQTDRWTDRQSDRQTDFMYLCSAGSFSYLQLNTLYGLNS